MDPNQTAFLTAAILNFWLTDCTARVKSFAWAQIRVQF